MKWSDEWAKWPEYLWGVVELLLFCFSILGAIALIVVVIGGLFLIAKDLVEEWLYDLKQKRRMKERSLYKKQGGPW